MKRLPLRPGPPGQAVAAGTGFSTVTMLRVRARAGGGDIWQASCEACAARLGLYGGAVRRVVQPGPAAPGCGPGVTGSAANAVLLCGGCAAACEAEDPHMRAAGFWQPPGADPRAASMMLHGPGGGTLVWRDDAGAYRDVDGQVIR